MCTRFALRSVRIGCVSFVFAALAAGAAWAQWRPEGPFLGRVQDLAVDVQNPDIVYAAVTGSGVWRTDDWGLTWSLPSSDLVGTAVNWVQVDPNRSTTLWAGFDGSTGASRLLRSRDAGATWHAVNDGYKGGSVHATGRPIVIVPGSPGTILVPSSNLHYRSDDGGETWSDFRVPNQDVYVFAVHPSDPKIILAGGRGQTLSLSRSTDGGKTWRQTGLGIDQESVSRLFFDPADPSIVYAVGGTFGKVYRSIDGGDEWTELSLPRGGTDSLFQLFLAPDRTLWAPSEQGLLFSRDGGRSWQTSRQGLGWYLCQAVASDPREPKRMLAANSGTGVYRSSDGGATWAPSSIGLTAGWVERLYGWPGSEALLAQLSVGLYRHEAGATDRLRAWPEVQEPFKSDGPIDSLDGFVRDRKSPRTLFAFDGSKLWRSTDDGRSWQEQEQKGPSLKDMMKGNVDTVEFHSLVQDPGNPQTLYAGSWSSHSEGGAVFKSTDGGKKWKPAGQGLPTEEVGQLASEQAGVVFAVVDGKSLYRTTNGAGSWAESGKGLPDGKILDLMVDAKAPTNVYVVGEDGLYRSADTGSTWTRAFAEQAVTALVIDAGSGALFAGSPEGVWRSIDSGSTWTPMNDGLANTNVRALAVSGAPPRLFAGLAAGSVVSIALP